MNRDHWLLVDADDTILGVEIDGKIQGTATAYTHVLTGFGALMEDVGLAPAKEALRIQNEMDHAMAQKYGFLDKSRFPRSIQETFNRLLQDTKRPAPEGLTEMIHDLSWQVFQYPYVALPGAMDTLATLSKTFRIAVVTKGCTEEQHKKLFDSGTFIYADQVFVLGHKNEEDWDRVIDTLEIPDANRHLAWAIGNSVKSDINIPLTRGFSGLHIDGMDTWSFEEAEYETPRHPARLEVTKDIRDALRIIPQG